ncbi:MAG: 6-bladed beta-propeller [Verrucomicrobia bacterium]|nr:6-bladed beta-propeller [Verrucomicrobiota bacterium]
MNAFWRPPKNNSLALLCLHLSAVAALADSSGPVWPPPPAAPRIAYVQSITGPADLGIRRSFWKRFFSAIVGIRQRDVLRNPLGVALNEQGDLLVTDTGDHSVSFFDRTHHDFHRWRKIGAYEFISPVAVAVAGNKFFVADSAVPAVIAFDEKGKFRFAITNGLARPVALAIAGGKLFVADSSTHRIVTFDLDGRKLGEFGRRGTASGEFNFPSHLTVDREGHLLVTDSMNARVQILEPGGKPLGVVGGLGDNSGHFSRPKGVAVDGFGHVYVADAAFDNVQIFNPRGQLLLYFGEPGQAAGEFWLPNGIAIGRDNRIYVADTFNRRVQVFQYLGTE